MNREVLQRLLDKYVSLVNSGDCGFWDPETEQEVIDARAELAKTQVLQIEGLGEPNLDRKPTIPAPPMPVCTWYRYSDGNVVSTNHKLRITYGPTTPAFCPFCAKLIMVMNNPS